MFLRIFKHLLPNSRAWKITVDKQLREFFEGLSNALGDDVKTFYDEIFSDIDPQKTRELGAWEAQWSLANPGLTEQERRDRLGATWKALGGQDPRYIEDTLRAAGFDVYVHEWWETGTNPPVTRNPLLYLRREFANVALMVECGEALAECGEAFAEAGNQTEPTGYPLVNKVFESVPILLPLCGEAVAECGEALAECGSYLDLQISLKNYIVPDDPDKWPYFLYIGGEVFGTLAQVDPKRKDEFEDLCLRICPTEQWLGILVDYV